MSLPRNLPNLITGSRLVLAGLLFGVLTLVQHGQGAPDPEGLAEWCRDHERLLFNVSLAIFLLAALSDIADGEIARRWGLTTDFGRIVDPFADKVIVCGAFVMLVPLEGSLVSAWMVVLILARELLVDGLRGFAESRGVAFPASAAGKAKMFTQCVCLIWIFAFLANFPQAGWAATVTAVLVYATVVLTLVSGVLYLVRARKVLKATSLAQLSSGGGAA